MGSQSEILFHEILDGQKILVFSTEIWPEQLKKAPCTTLANRVSQKLE